jgi:hypothetical protein
VCRRRTEDGIQIRTGDTEIYNQKMSYRHDKLLVN